MSGFEYRVVPAPRRGRKAKGVRTPEERFAHAVESEMNRMAAEGWEFVRSDTLPSEQKSGWFSRPVTVFQTLLVFRRPLAEAVAQAPRAAMPPPVGLTPPAAVASPPALAASRHAPLPDAPLPANLGAPSAPPPPAMSVAAPPEEPSPATLALFGELSKVMESPRPVGRDARRAAE